MLGNGILLVHQHLVFECPKNPQKIWLKEQFDQCFAFISPLFPALPHYALKSQPSTLISVMRIITLTITKKKHYTIEPGLQQPEQWWKIQVPKLTGVMSGLSMVSIFFGYLVKIMHEEITRRRRTDGWTDRARSCCCWRMQTCGKKMVPHFHRKIQFISYLHEKHQPRCILKGFSIN